MSINPFDPPALIKTLPPSAPNRATAGYTPPPLPKGREIRIPVFDDGERPAPPNAKA
jgi:hypothetical protein